MKQVVLNIRNKQGNTDIAFPCTKELLDVPPKNEICEQQKM